MMKTKLLFLLTIVWFTAKSQNVDIIFEDISNQYLVNHPEYTTLLGLQNKNELFKWQLNDLSDASPVGEYRDIQWAKYGMSKMRQIDNKELSNSQRMSVKILKWYLSNRIDGENFIYHTYPINPVNGSHIELPRFLMSSHPVTDDFTARAYLERLSKIEIMIDQIIESVDYREQLRIVAPKFILSKVSSLSEDFIKVPAVEHPLYQSFKTKLDNIDLSSKDELLKETVTLLEKRIYPAYEKLIERIEKQLKIASDEAGVWKLPNGDAYYAYALKEHTTTNYTPEEVHKIGLSEVARIENAIKVLLEKEGIKEGSTLDRIKRFESLSSNKSKKYENNEEGRQALIRDIERLLEKTKKKMSVAFDIMPKSELEVTRMPQFIESSGPGAYYSPPAMDGSRPGQYNINLKNVELYDSDGSLAQAFHEGIPGHHFQLALQQEIPNLPTFRNIFIFNAYVEGWALYAEQLAGEYGLFPNTKGELSQLKSELFRALRVVIDTGIHYKRWTRQQAIDYFTSHITIPLPFAESEVDRYIVWPGQAVSYKIGMMKILELREYAAKQLGDEFDIKKFHNVVLKNGSLPLDILDEEVQSYVNSELGH